MANASRTAALLVTLAVGLVVGWLLHRAPSPPVVTLGAGFHLIEVGPTAKDLSEPSAEISQRKDHKVFWIPQDETKTLGILFKAADFPAASGKEPPFAGGQNGQDFMVPCSNGTCRSGHINSALRPTVIQPLKYKYWQILVDSHGNKDEQDGWIIIKP